MVYIYGQQGWLIWNANTGQTAPLVTAARGHAAFSGDRSRVNPRAWRNRAESTLCGQLAWKQKERKWLSSFSFQTHKSSPPLHLLYDTVSEEVRRGQWPHWVEVLSHGRKHQRWGRLALWSQPLLGSEVEMDRQEKRSLKTEHLRTLTT